MTISVTCASALAKNVSRTASSVPTRTATNTQCLVSRPHARTYSSSSLPRPYRFHVGASWAGKPQDPRTRVKTQPFPPDSPIGKWRDAVLSKPNPGAGRHIGEDFFYIQDVSVSSAVERAGVGFEWTLRGCRCGKDQ